LRDLVRRIGTRRVLRFRTLGEGSHPGERESRGRFYLEGRVKSGRSLVSQSERHPQAFAGGGFCAAKERNYLVERAGDALFDRICERSVPATPVGKGLKMRDGRTGRQASVSALSAATR